MYRTRSIHPKGLCFSIDLILSLIPVRASITESTEEDAKQAAPLRPIHAALQDSYARPAHLTSLSLRGYLADLGAHIRRISGNDDLPVFAGSPAVPSRRPAGRLGSSENKVCEKQTRSQASIFMGSGAPGGHDSSFSRFRSSPGVVVGSFARFPLLPGSPLGSFARFFACFLLSAAILAGLGSSENWAPSDRKSPPCSSCSSCSARNRHAENCGASAPASGSAANQPRLTQ